MIQVYINSRLVKTVNDPKNPPLIPMTGQEEIVEAWDVIGKSPFGSCRACYNEQGLMTEFLCY